MSSIFLSLMMPLHKEAFKGLIFVNGQVLSGSFGFRSWTSSSSGFSFGGLARWV
jgi:hypothetical protein